MVVVILMASSPSPSSSIQFSNSFPCKQLLHPKSNLSFSTTTTRATDPESNTTTDPTTRPSSPPAPETSTDSFENRLTRIKYRSGIGKKAEQRKGKKSKKLSSTGGGGSDVFLPPVPLKEPVSGGLKVNLGFDPYAERLNGRLAILGMVALLLVELGSGKSVIKYHTPSVVFLQVYFIASVTALYVKFEKEKVSIWPISAKK